MLHWLAYCRTTYTRVRWYHRYSGGKIIVWLVTFLTRLDSTKEVNVLLFVPSEAAESRPALSWSLPLRWVYLALIWEWYLLYLITRSTGLCWHCHLFLSIYLFSNGTFRPFYSIVKYFNSWLLFYFFSAKNKLTSWLVLSTVKIEKK